MIKALKITGALIILLGTALAISHYAHADVYVVYDGKTNEIKSLSDIDDAQLEKGWKKEILPLNFGDMELLYKPMYYKFKDGKFMFNMEKMSQDTLRIEQNQKLQERNKIINERMRSIAEAQLIEEGILEG